MSEGRKDDGMSESLYLDALTKWGPQAQCDQCIEEMAELTVAIRHRSRGKTADVCGEIADVLIMAEQMRLLFGADAVDKIKADKLARLRRRLDGVQA